MKTYKYLYTLAFSLFVAIAYRLGIRSRLRCPKCRSVGTYKPYCAIHVDGILTKRPRWLCKYCGYYRDKFYIGGESKCVVVAGVGFWQLKHEVMDNTGWDGESEKVPSGATVHTPMTAVKAVFDGIQVNPWVG